MDDWKLKLMFFLSLNPNTVIMIKTFKLYPTTSTERTGRQIIGRQEVYQIPGKQWNEECE